MLEGRVASTHPLFKPGRGLKPLCHPAKEVAVMPKHWMFVSTAAVAAAALVSACGGGGGGGGDPIFGGPILPNGEGFFAGFVTDAAGASIPGEFFNVVILDNQRYFATLSTTPGPGVTTIIEGTGSFTNPSFSSPGARAYGLRSGLAPSMASLNHAQTVSTVSGNLRIPPTAPDTDLIRYRAGFETGYNSAASLTTLAGVYSGSVSRVAVGSPSWTLSIGPTGTFTAAQGSCLINGSFTPRPGGRAIFNFSASYDAASCAGDSSSFTGVGYNTTGTGGTLGVVLTAVTAGRSDALFGVLARN